ncbi:MAG: carboxypeptidase regulatory-like domain-containing protein [Bryobacterales bacterium]|nr:carboxypeptidase regulatory-like domain-containing protein [Bryobacterales bacterium]
MYKFLFAVVLTMLYQGAGTAQTGSLLGTVVLDGAKAVAGARVWVRKPPDLRKNSQGVLLPIGPAYTTFMLSDAAGGFAFQKLPPGHYVVCATGVAKAQLPSCDWSQPQPVVDVAAGKTSTGVVANLRTGVVLNFVVQDPAGRILTGKRFRIGVSTSTGMYYAAVLSAASATQYTYSIGVPPGIALRLFLDAAVPVQDALSQPVANGQQSLAISVPTSGEAVVALKIP